MHELNEWLKAWHYFKLHLCCTLIMNIHSHSCSFFTVARINGY